MIYVSNVPYILKPLICSKNRLALLFIKGMFIFNEINHALWGDMEG